MIELFPFPGWRFRPAAAGPIERLVAPPYDKIDAQMRAELLERSPYNIVHVSLDAERPGDDQAHNRYTRARDALSAWAAQGVIARDPSPAVYLYLQEYVDPADGKRQERLGIVGLIRATPVGRDVLPHERTFREHKEDRRRLLDATGVHLGQIFLLYRDPHRRIEETTARFRERRPDIDVAWMEAPLRGSAAGGPASGRPDRGSPGAGGARTEGQRHRLWRIDDPDVIRVAQDVLRAQQAVIADGHHRYETAATYAEDHADAAPDDPLGPSTVMVTLINTEQPGLRILPTHRLVPAGAADGQCAAATLAEHYQLAAVPLPGDGVEPLLQAMAEARSRGPAFGWLSAHAREGFLVTPQRPYPRAPRSAAEAHERLEVAILHRHILGELLGLGELPPECFVKDPRAARAAVRTGQAAMAFLVNAVDVPTVHTIASGGLRLPQKSTDFYPKLLTGLVWHRIRGVSGCEEHA